MSGGCPKRLEDFFSLHFTFYMSNLIIVKIKCLPEEMLVKKMIVVRINTFTKKGVSKV